jgi:membrane protein
MTTAPVPEAGGDPEDRRQASFGAERPRAPFAFARFARDSGNLAKDAAVRWSDDACLRLGASLAFYALFSIFPLLLLSVTAVGFFLGDDAALRRRMLDSVASAASPASRTILDETLQSMQSHHAARGIGAVVGLVTLVLGASGVFSELETSLNQIWRVKAAPTRGIWSTVLEVAKAKAFSFAVVVVAASSLLALLVVGTALNAVSDSVTGQRGGAAFWRLGEMAVSFAFLALLLAAVYRVVPQTPVAWRDVFPAALVTSLLFVALKGLLAWYLGHLASYAAYGAVGGVLGLLTWIYIASLVLFYGAEFSRVYAERFGSLREAPASPTANAASGT